MATCSPQDLLTAGIGFERLVNLSDANAVKLYLLSQIDGGGDTVQQLLDAAGQFRNLTPDMAQAVRLQQLCIWSGGN